MSFKTFISKLWHNASHLFEALVPKFKLATHFGVTILEGIKNFDLAHPEAADILTSLIPGTLDDAIKNKLRTEIPKLAVELHLVEAGQEGTNDPNRIMVSLIKAFPELTDRAKKVFSHGLATLIAELAADGDFKWQDAMIATQYYFEEKFKQGQPINVEAVTAEQQQQPINPLDPTASTS